MSDVISKSPDAGIIFPPDIMISDMEEGDLEDVMAIERSTFSEPWSENMFRQELHFPLSRHLTARVAGQGIVGYITFWIMAGEVHLLNIAVKNGQRRVGVASTLMREMIRRARKEGARHATLEVRPSNEGAARLYERFGFEVRGRRPLYYADTKEDALIMWAELGGNRENDGK